MKDGELYGRYTITHKDGEPIDPGKRHFVLSPDTDPAALAALGYYATVVAATHPILAGSIRSEYQLAIVSVSGEGSQAAHVANESLADELWAWVAAQAAYARAYANRRGGIGSRNEALRAEVAYYDAGQALYDAVEYEGLATVPDPPRPPSEDEDDDE